MAGNLRISEINGGQISYRNIIINGFVNTPFEINQRVATFNSVSNGDYFADRWKRVNSNFMTQIIEEGNFNRGATYCLSGDGVTTTVLTAPTAGNWTLPNISKTAFNIQLEQGTIPSTTEYKPISLEFSLCQRYYQKSYNISTVPGSNTSVGVSDSISNESGTFTGNVTFNTLMRISPTITTYSFTGSTTLLPGSSPGQRGFFVTKVAAVNSNERFHWVADAEL